MSKQDKTCKNDPVTSPCLSITHLLPATCSSPKVFSQKRKKGGEVEASFQLETPVNTPVPFSARYSSEKILRSISPFDYSSSRHICRTGAGAVFILPPPGMSTPMGHVPEYGPWTPFKCVLSGLILRFWTKLVCIFIIVDYPLPPFPAHCRPSRPQVGRMNTQARLCDPPSGPYP